MAYPPFRMPSFNFGRDEGILTLEEVQYVEAQIVQAIRPVLQARKIMPITKYPNAGYFFAKWYEETDMGRASVTMYGDSQSGDTPIYEDKDVKIPIVSKDFKIRWRDILASRNMGPSLEVQTPANAGRQVAEEEDLLCLTGEHTGSDFLGIQGLSTAFGRQTTAASGAWPGAALTDINTARGLLQAAGFVDVPFVMIGPVAQIKKLDAYVTNQSMTWRKSFVANDLLAAIFESDNVRTLINGVDSVLIVQPDPMNFDIIEAMAPRVGWWEYKDGNMYGHVKEAVTPRIKRPLSICEITGIP